MLEKGPALVKDRFRFYRRGKGRQTCCDAMSTNASGPEVVMVKPSAYLI